MSDRIPLCKPSFGREESLALQETLESGWWGRGPRAIEFEESFAQYVGAEHAVALNSATAALHLAMLAAMRPSDERYSKLPLEDGGGIDEVLGFRGMGNAHRYEVALGEKLVHLDVFDAIRFLSGDWSTGTFIHTWILICSFGLLLCQIQRCYGQFGRPRVLILFTDASMDLALNRPLTGSPG